MRRCSCCIATLCAFVSTANSVTLGLWSYPTLRSPQSAVEMLITPLPSPAPDGELRKRQVDTRYICGYGYNVDDTFTCNSHTQYCKGTILNNGQAYAYCSDSRIANQYIYTTAYGNWPTDRDCPTSAECCYTGADEPFVRTDFFVASGYTVTWFDCEVTEAVTSWNPNTQLLNPASFSASLAQLATSTSSSSSSTSTTSSTTSSKSAGTGGDTTSSSSSSGLSSGAKAGIGAGVGVGVGVVLIALVAYIFWRRHKKKKERLAEISPSPAHPPGPQAAYVPETSYNPHGSYSPQPPYSPPMSYNDTQYKYSQDQAQWSPPTQQSPPPTTDQHAPAELSAQVAPGWDQPYELQGQPDPPKP